MFSKKLLNGGVSLSVEWPCMYINHLFRLIKSVKFKFLHFESYLDMGYEFYKYIFPFVILQYIACVKKFLLMIHS